jgi:hypothetical protein
LSVPCVCVVYRQVEVSQSRGGGGENNNNIFQNFPWYLFWLIMAI